MASGTKPCPICKQPSAVDATNCAHCGALLRRKSGRLPDPTPPRPGSAPVPPPPMPSRPAGPAFPPPPSGMRNTVPVNTPVPPDAFVENRAGRTNPAPPDGFVPALGDTRGGRTRDPYVPPLGDTRGGRTVPPAFPGGPVPPRFPGDTFHSATTLPGAPVDTEEARAALKARYERPRPAPLVVPRRRYGPVVFWYTVVISVVTLMVYGAYHMLAAQAWLTVDNGLRDKITVAVDGMTPITLMPDAAAHMGFDAAPRRVRVFDSLGHLLADQTLDIERPPIWGSNEPQRYVYNVGGGNQYAIYTIAPYQATDATGKPVKRYHLLDDAVRIESQVFFKNPAAFSPGEFIKYSGVYIDGSTRVLGHFPIHRKGQCCAWLRAIEGADKFMEPPPSTK
ncbi:MAG: zinc ribbon domain-containing protein [Candidatus Xenobia bacterium]